MWAVEKDPALRSDFTNITVLEGRPDEERIRAKVAAALDVIPRLRQRVVSPPLRLAPPEWCDDPTFDLDYHLRRVSLPAPGRMRELLDLAATLSSTPLDRSRPLWAFTLVEGLEGGRVALLQQVHHTITDGVGGLRLSLSLVDLEPEPAEAPTVAAGIAAEVAAQEQAATEADPVPRTSPLDVVGDAIGWAIRTNARLAGRSVAAAARLASHPTEVPARAADAVALAASIRRQLLITDAARSPLLASRSLARRYEVFQAPLDEAKAAARRLGGTLNDLYVTGVAGALGIYHERMGMPCDELRMAMPVSLRTGGEVGGEADGGANQFAPTRLMVPLQPKEPAPRFERVHEALATVRAEPVLSAAGPLSALLAPLPTALLVNVARSQSRSVDFATSNLRGSPVPLYLGGQHIVASFPMGPRSGVALNVTMLSYENSLDMGLNLDPGAITDPAALVAAMTESFEGLLDSSGSAT